MTQDRMMNRLAVMTLLLLGLLPIVVRADSKPAEETPCPYPTAHDAPLDATEKLITTTADYSLFRVEFNGIKTGSRVPANLYVPRKSQFKAPYPAVLLQYGTGGNKNTNYIVAIGQ